MDAFRAALKNDRAVTLDVAVLDLATIEYPGLEPGPYLALLDEMAAAVEACVGPARDGARFIAAANYILFERFGFRGNQDEYYDPRNSCLNHVLDRKLGIPITLSVVYMEVARRLRMPVFGVGLPGHFLVQYDDDEYRTFIDPFHGGRLLGADDCRALAKDIAGVDLASDSSILKPVSDQYILARMLNNLRSVYHRAQAHRKLIAVLDLLLEAYPSEAEYYRHRAVARVHARELLAAGHDFRKYLELSPESPDREEIRKQIEAIHRWLGSVN
jgi:regulator of sirC expression with transglutaminase-like and TPR domain